MHRVANGPTADGNSHSAGSRCCEGQAAADHADKPTLSIAADDVDVLGVAQHVDVGSRTPSFRVLSGRLGSLRPPGYSHRGPSRDTDDGAQGNVFRGLEGLHATIRDQAPLVERLGGGVGQIISAPVEKGDFSFLRCDSPAAMCLHLHDCRGGSRGRG